MNTPVVTVEQAQRLSTEHRRAAVITALEAVLAAENPRAEARMRLCIEQEMGRADTLRAMQEEAANG